MIFIRQAAVTDVDTVRAIVMAAYQGYVPRIGLKPGPMRSDYQALVRAGRVWVAEDDGEVVGLVVLVPEPDHLLVENVAVSPAAQGGGIGSRLLEFAEEQARRYGLPEVRLYTHELMSENIAYYGRRGYVETHRQEVHGFKRVFFRKTLP